MADAVEVIEVSNGIVARCLVGLVKQYQTKLSSRSKLVCPFEPSCSEYMILAIGKCGAIRGVAKGIARICRCNPYYSGERVDWP
jgi:putative membrane protein insertion efficiency factor